MRWRESRIITTMSFQQGSSAAASEEEAALYVPMPSDNGRPARSDGRSSGDSLVSSRCHRSSWRYRQNRSPVARS